MKLLKLIGFASLLHAGYSSYEFSHIQKSYNTTLPFPQDITFEVIIALTILIIDLFLTPAESKISLISNDVLQNDYKLKPILMKDALIEDEKLGAGPFKIVETRPTFVDVSQKRKEYAEWTFKNEELLKKDIEKSDEKKEDDEEKAQDLKEQVKEETKKDESAIDVSNEGDETKSESKSMTSTSELQNEVKETKSKKKNGKKSKKV